MESASRINFQPIIFLCKDYQNNLSFVTLGKVFLCRDYQNKFELCNSCLSIVYIIWMYDTDVFILFTRKS